jgi:acyl carrier protein
MLKEEVYSKVAATIAETLSMDAEEIHPTSRLQADLGAESIDVVDLMFRLESEFGIDIPECDFHPAVLFQQHPELVHNGRLTECGLAALQDRMPYADLSALAPNSEKKAVNDVFTVEVIARYVEARLHAAATAEAERCKARRVSRREPVEIWPSLFS